MEISLSYTSESQSGDYILHSSSGLLPGSVPDEDEENRVVVASSSQSCESEKGAMPKVVSKDAPAEVPGNGEECGYVSGAEVPLVERPQSPAQMSALRNSLVDPHPQSPVERRSSSATNQSSPARVSDRLKVGFTPSSETSPRATSSSTSRSRVGLSKTVESQGSRRSRISVNSTASDYGPETTFNIKEGDLVDNACAEALQHLRKGNTLGSEGIKRSLDSVHGMQELHVVDWDKPHNLQRLRDLCRFLRSLFWAFTEEDHWLRSNTLLPPPVSKACQCARRIMKTEAFGGFFFLLTLYALFGPDAAGMMGHTSTHNADLAALNTAVFFLFLLEAALNCWATPRFFLSGNFWIDIFATMTILGDTVIANELIESDAAVAGRGTRMARLVRIGGRGSRFVRLMRVARVVQVVRLMPRIMQRSMNKSTNELASLLLHKRLWLVFTNLDKHKNVLSEPDLDLFFTALHVEFRQAEAKLEMEESAKTNTQMVTDLIGDAIAKSRQLVAERLEQGAGLGKNSFEDVVASVMSKRIGKVLMQRCVDDIECMKDSCALLQTAISRLTLKICVLVLSILIALPLLEANVTEHASRDQGLALLFSAKQELTSKLNGLEVFDGQSFCSFVDSYAVRAGGGTATLKLLIVESKVYIDSVANKIACSAQAPLVVGKLIDFADASMTKLGLQPLEMSLRCFPDSACGDSAKVGSLALWEISEEAFISARASMLYTSIVCIMMILLVLFFALSMKSSSNMNLFHPLWEMMDDMCALKNMEVVAGGLHCIEGAPTSEDFHAKKSQQAMCALCRSQPEVAQELLQLRAAFFKLRGAILSWGKYVPTVLLRQLYEAGVEATIGASHCDVTIFFCDISNFQELCHEKNPKQCLEILGTVLAVVYEVLEEHAGVMLEFIGDEVLAIFNAPIQIEDHTRAAVTSAIEIIDKTRLLDFHGERPKLQCSVHRANVLAGNLGSPTRMKYGVMGDGVNLTARLKSLNSRYGTQFLCSTEALDFPDAHDDFVVRPIGRLVLKGRSVPTPTFEILAKRPTAMGHIVKGGASHVKGFELFCSQQFEEAKALFAEAHHFLSSDGNPDRPSEHMMGLCDKYIQEPPDGDFDGREKLAKKAW